MMDYLNITKCFFERDIKAKPYLGENNENVIHK